MHQKRDLVPQTPYISGEYNVEYVVLGMAMWHQIDRPHWMWKSHVVLVDVWSTLVRRSWKTWVTTISLLMVMSRTLTFPHICKWWKIHQVLCQSPSNITTFYVNNVVEQPLRLCFVLAILDWKGFNKEFFTEILLFALISFQVLKFLKGDMQWFG